MKYVELIIFDLDGTLVDSKESIAQGINVALEEVGLKRKSTLEISSYIGRGVDYLIEGSLGPGNEGLLEQTKRVFEDYRRQSPDSSDLYPGAKDILEYFKDKKKVIITNRKREFALPTLKRLDILKYFDDVVGEDGQECKKPSACPLEKIMEHFKIKKDEAIMVGDMDIDVLAGKNAHIATCGVTYGIGEKEDILKINPDFIIGDISQLKSIIN